MSMKRTEEIDDEGRRRVTFVQEPPVEIEAAVTAEEETITTGADSWYVARGWVKAVAAVILVGLAAVEALLAFRLGFLLAGANQNNGFVDFIYDFSGPLVDPFEGIIGNEAVDGGVFEPAALIAMLVYAVATVLVVAFMFALTAAPSPSGEHAVATRVRHTREAGHEH
jgi:hypothetical protein